MSLRTPLIAGNWKMNKTATEGAELAKAVAAAVGIESAVQVVLCPPFTALTAAVAAVDFFYADRGDVRLKPGGILPTDFLPVGVKAQAGEPGRLQVTVDAAGLKGAAAFFLVDFLAGLPKAVEAVESAAPRHIDWRREVELIKANSSR